MKTKKFHINSDNIHMVNNHLKRQFRINRRRDRTAPIARFVSVVLYLASSCLLFYGIGCKIDPSMSTVPVLSSIWNTYYSYLPFFDMAWYFSLLAMILTVYVPIFVAPMVIYLLACLLYHPKAEFETPSGSGYEQAHILVENQKKQIPILTYHHGCRQFPLPSRKTYLLFVPLSVRLSPHCAQ